MEAGGFERVRTVLCFPPRRRIPSPRLSPTFFFSDRSELDGLSGYPDYPLFPLLPGAGGFHPPFSPPFSLLLFNLGNQLKVLSKPLIAFSFVRPPVLAD